MVEIHISIFSYLDVWSLVFKASLVNRHWHSSVFRSEVTAWQEFDFGKIKNPTEFLRLLEERKTLKNLKKLTCPGMKQLPFYKQFFTQGREKLIEFKCSFGYFKTEQDGFSILAKICPNLEILSLLESKDFIEQDLFEISQLKNLKQLIVPLPKGPKNVIRYYKLFETKPNFYYLNLFDDSKFVPIDIFCALCKNPFYNNLSKYFKNTPQQSHIQLEIFTNEPPIHNFVETHKTYQNPRKLACKNYCHGDKWPIDNMSGLIKLYGFQYGIAIVTGLVAFCPSEKKDRSTK